MIKLIRGDCPAELDAETISELTDKYINDNKKDVWNSPKVKAPLKKALTDMTHNKCAYCECELDIEAKDVTIDHFAPKVDNSELVIMWENLLPTCLRCNRKKNRKVDEIIDPCNIEPRDHLGIKKGGVRLAKKNNSELGYNTIKVIGLNDIDRVMKARMIVVEKIIEKLIELQEDIEDAKKITGKYVTRFENFISEAEKDRPYSAVVSARILDCDSYKKIKSIFKSNGIWNDNLSNIEEELEKIALEIL